MSSRNGELKKLPADKPSVEKPTSLIQKWKNYKFGTEYDQLWLLIIVVVVAIVVCTILELEDVRSKLLAHPDPKLKPWSDLWKMFGMACLTFLIKKGIYLAMDPIFDARLKLSNFADHDARLERVHDYVFGIFFYGFATVFAFYTYWGNPNIPTLLGGTGEGLFYWRNWPHLPVESQPFKYVEWYYPVQMGYHFHNLVHQGGCKSHRKTYIEMVLHHLLTWVLIFYSYYTNTIAFGVTVLMVHDVGDFVMNIGKVVRDLQLLEGKIVDFMYLSIVLSWLYPRVIIAWLSYIPAGMMLSRDCSVMPKGVCDYVDPTKYIGIVFLPWLLLILSLMNFYWIILIIGVGCEKKKQGGYVAAFQGEQASLNVGVKKE